MGHLFHGGYGGFLFSLPVSLFPPSFPHSSPMTLCSPHSPQPRTITITLVLLVLSWGAANDLFWSCATQKKIAPRFAGVPPFELYEEESRSDPRP